MEAVSDTLRIGLQSWASLGATPLHLSDGGIVSPPPLCAVPLPVLAVCISPPHGSTQAAHCPWLV